MPTFQLGQRVKISGTAKKHRTYAQITFIESGLPEWNDAWGKSRTIHEGVIVGSRTVASGTQFYEDEYGTGFQQDTGTARRVWLVAFHLRRKPIMCFDHQIEAFPVPETVTVPMPHVPFPGGRTQAHFMRTAARNIKNDHPVGGYGVTTAVIKLLTDTANAMENTK